MAIKAPIPEVPAPVWRNFKDLQEWEALHQTRPEGDKHSALFESVTEGIHSFPGGFVVTTVGRRVPQLGAQVVGVAGDVRARLLRDRDDGDVLLRASTSSASAWCRGRRRAIRT